MKTALALVLVASWSLPAAGAQGALAQGAGEQEAGELATGEQSGRNRLLEIPDPNLDGADQNVTEQITAQLQKTRALVADPTTTDAELAEAYGELGQILLLYTLPTPAEAAFSNALQMAPGDHRWHYFLGVIQQEMRRLDEAKEQFLAVLELDPSYLSALIRVGDIELLSNRPGEAKGWYEKAIEIYPPSPAAHWGLGQIASAAGDPAAAVVHYEAVLEAQPQATSAHYPLALAFRQLGDMERARQHMEQRGKGMVKPLEPLLDKQPQLITGASIYMTRGNKAFTRGDYEMACRLYQLAVEAQPANLTARHALATCLSKKGDLSEAAAQLELVLEQDANNGVAHYNLGTIYSQLDNVDKSLQHYQRAVELVPELVNARFNYGILLEDLGRLDEALEQYLEVGRLNPQDANATIRRSVLLARLGHIEEAETELRRLLQVDPGDLEARLALGRTLGEARRTEEALVEFHTVAESATERQTEARAHFEAGRLLLATGNTTGAIDSLSRTVELMPNITEAHATLANALARAQRFDEAADEFQFVVERQPTSREAQVGLAISLLLGGHDSRSVQALEAGLQALPEQIELLHLLARILATSNDARVRQGDRALRLGQQVLMRQQTPSHAETVAMALAESGRFEEAVQLQTTAIREASRQGSAELEQMQDRLSTYQRGEAVRSPWLANGRP